MEIKDYCSYELSMKLKELGFNEDTLAQWAAEPDGKPALMSSALMPSFRNSECCGRDVAAPFLWEAQKWLREEKGLCVQVNLNGVRSAFYVEVWLRIPNGRVLSIGQQFDDYDDGLSAGIERALEYLEKGK